MKRSFLHIALCGAAALAVSAAVRANVFAQPQPASPQSAPDAAEWRRLADNMRVRFAILDNNPSDCPAEVGAGCFHAELSFTMPERLPAGAARGVKIYYGFVTRMLAFQSDTFQDRLVNGDLRELSLRPGTDLTPGGRYTMRLTGRGDFFSTSYVMPNLYLVAPGGEAMVIRSTVPVIDPETGLEQMTFVAPMTDEARLARGSAPDLTEWRSAGRDHARYASWDAATPRPSPTMILPTPYAETAVPGRALDLRRGISVSLQGVERAALAPALARLAADGAAETRGGARLTVSVDPALRLAGLRDPALASSPERYSIAVGAQGIDIRAASSAGASAALFGLSQQVASDRGRLRPMRVEDAPRFGFRGLHIDVARNFHSLDQLLTLVEQMARYKLNKLHLHLADDEGWRLEIPGLSELTEVGAFRCHDLEEERCLLPQLGAGPSRDVPQNGYLSRADYVRLLRAAQARHIEVIPSFDMPGHSRAAIRSMESRFRRLTRAGDAEGAALYRLAEPGDTTQYRSIQNYNDNTLNPCLPATYRFFGKVLDELQAMHAETGVPLRTYHIGADETAGAWLESPACRAAAGGSAVNGPAIGAMFIERVAGMLGERNIRPAGWSDGMSHTNPANMPRGSQTNIWAMLLPDASAMGHRQANLGWRAVISVPDVTYLDHPQAFDPDEPGYDWASRATDLFKVYSLMPENLPANASWMRDLMNRPGQSSDPVPLVAPAAFGGLQGHLWSETVRTDDRVEYMLFPRLLALAEKAWRRADWEVPYQAGISYAHGDARLDAAAVTAGWQGFRSRLALHMPLLDGDDIAYRIAPPGARLEAGRLLMNSELPGTRLEYRTGGAGPWRPYRAPVNVGSSVEVRARSADGRRAGRSVTISAAPAQ